MVDEEAAEQRTTGNREASPWRAMAAPRVVGLGLVYFGVVYGLYAVSFFLPTVVAGFAERFDAEYSIFETGAIVAVPFLVGAVAMVLWSRHSDSTVERTWHLALPAALGGVTIPVALYLDSPFAVMATITLTAVGVFCALPVFWYLPPLVLTGAGAAVGIALINSVGNLGGYIGPFVIGALKEYTGNLASGLYFLSGVMVFGLLLTAVVYQVLERRHALPVDKFAASARS